MFIPSPPVPQNVILFGDRTLETGAEKMPCEQEDGCLQPRIDSSLTVLYRYQPSQHFDFGLLASKTMRK